MCSQYQNDEIFVKHENNDNANHYSDDEFLDMVQDKKRKCSKIDYDEILNFIVCRYCKLILDRDVSCTKCKYSISPNDSIDTDISTSLLNTTAIKSKITSGEFKINHKSGKSRIWNIFGRIENKSGDELPNLVICRSCRNIYKSKSTSNLVKHKCYITSITKQKEVGTKIQADADIKENIANLLTEWIIVNCRPYEVVEDSGFQKVIEFILSVGEKFGSTVDLNSLLPHPTTISQSVNKMYNIYFQKIKAELTPIKSIGFGLTSDLYNDKYLKKTYIAVTIHYINDSNLISRVLGLKSIEGEKCTYEDITLKAGKILKEYDLDFDDKVIIVTHQDASMISAFGKNNHIFCIVHLLYNALEKSMQEIADIAKLSHLCTKLLSHFEITYPCANLHSTLKSFSSNHWSQMYNLYVSIERNWSEIVQLLKRKNELIININLNHITAIIEVLKPFQETFEKLQGENYVTIHLVHVYINRLKKKCSYAKTDLKIQEQLKEKLKNYLDSIVLKNLNIYHKIGLFLFPPANKLIQFSEDERILIKDECKRIMRSYLQDIPEPEDKTMTDMSGISIDNSELFSDFVENPQNINSVDKTANEILMYENKNVRFYDDFNILQWWNVHKNEFPLLYKVSCKILATPASSATSVKLFSLARNLISEQKIDFVSRDAFINEVIFLNSNIEKNELQKDLIKCSN